MLVRSLRSQHAQLLGLARKVAEPRSCHSKSHYGGNVRQALDELAAVLLAHLELEDRELYPCLLAAPDADVS